MVRESGHDIPFLVVSGTIGEERAVAMMKAGAHDYVMKSNLTRLAPAVAKRDSGRPARRELRPPRPSAGGWRRSSGGPRKWKASDGWPAPWPTISITC